MFDSELTFFLLIFSSREQVDLRRHAKFDYRVGEKKQEMSVGPFGQGLCPSGFKVPGERAVPEVLLPKQVKTRRL